MSRPIVKIHNIETDEIIEREMNNQELAAYEENEKWIAARDAEKAAQENKRKALLEKLGITDEEAKLLLG